MPRPKLLFPASLLAAALLWPAAGCRCPEKPEPKAKAPPTKAPRSGKPRVTHFPSQELRFHMRQVEVVTKELKRRAKRGQLGMAPKVLGKKIEEMPRFGAPERFITGMAELGKAAARLEGSKRPRHHYGLLVEGCVSCHKDLAKGMVGLVERLRLSTKEAEK